MSSGFWSAVRLLICFTDFQHDCVGLKVIFFLTKPPVDNKYTAVSTIEAQPESDFHIDYCALWVVQLKGYVASKVITA